MTDSNLKKILIDEINSLVDDKLTDLEYWMDRIDEGDIDIADAQNIIDDIMPYLSIEINFD